MSFPGRGLGVAAAVSWGFANLRCDSGTSGRWEGRCLMRRGRLGRAKPAFPERARLERRDRLHAIARPLARVTSPGARIVSRIGIRAGARQDDNHTSESFGASRPPRAVMPAQTHRHPDPGARPKSCEFVVRRLTEGPVTSVTGGHSKDQTAPSDSHARTTGVCPVNRPGGSQPRGTGWSESLPRFALHPPKPTEPARSKRGRRRFIR